MPLVKENLRKSFWFHLAVVLALCGIFYGLFFASLHWFTRHGEEVRIPDVTGKDMRVAIDQLTQMQFDVYIDSTYEPEAKPYSVLKQVPDTGSVVKHGRTVFLTVNMVTPPKVAMPSLIGLSYRSAEMLLRISKLKIGDTSYRPDIAAGAILEMQSHGTVLRAGHMIPQGSKIDLVIGNGLGNTEWEVPDVTGSTVDEAMTYLNQYNLQPIFIPKNDATQIADTFAAMIVDQNPRARDAAGNPVRIKMGDVIQLYIE
ncbi:MAG: PASTA domain-containing protein [Bacteroidota bacterium]